VSEDRVEWVNRGADAINRGDIDGLLENLDPAVEWSPAFPVVLGGEAKVYRGYEGVREMFHGFYEVLDEIHVEYSDVRDLGDKVLAIGRIRTRGGASGSRPIPPSRF
jgi:ketosteroid isomerase-like protein